MRDIELKNIALASLGHVSYYFLMTSQVFKQINAGTVLLLIVVSLALLVPGIGISFIDRDEGWYAQVVREMRAGGDWLVPRFRGEIWLGKPPLFYWLVGLSTTVLGWGEWQARLVPVLSSMFNVVLAGAFATRLFDRRVGLWTGLIFATFGMVTVSGKLLITDSLLLTFILLTVMLHWRMVVEGVTHVRAALYGSAIGLGILTKGPAILVFSGAFLIALLIAYPERRRAWLGNWRWWTWSMLALVVALPWHVYIYLVAPDVIINQYLVYEMTSRLASRTQGSQPGFPGFYLLISVVFLLPWTACVPTALVAAVRQRRESPAYPLLLIWLIIAWVFLELLRAKPPNYILPCYVPLAILVAAELVRLFDRTADWKLATPNTRAMVGLICWPVVFCFSLVAMLGLWNYRQVEGLTAGIAGLLTVTAFAVALIMAVRRGFRAACVTVVAGVVVMHMAFGILFFPTLEPHRLSRNLARSINAAWQPGDTIILCGYKEPTVYAYTDGVIQTVDPGGVETVLNTLPPGQSAVLAISESALDAQSPALKSRLSTFQNEAAAVTGINHIKRNPKSKLTWTPVTVFVGRI